MKIYTRKGDSGQTHLLFGENTSKSGIRCEAYGSTDEAISAMGLARSLTKEPLVKEILYRLQNEMFLVGAELATIPGDIEKFKSKYPTVTSDMVIRVEKDIDSVSEQTILPPSFIIPGASAGSAALDLARTALRRAERKIVSINELECLDNQEIMRYVNRVSDLLFVLARYEDKSMPFETFTTDKI